jgi:hypothetical protein
MISHASGVLLIRGACAHRALKQDTCKYEEDTIVRAFPPKFAAGTLLRGVFPFLSQQRSVFSEVSASCEVNLRKASGSIARMEKFPLKKLQVIHALSPDGSSFLVSPRQRQRCKDRCVD